MLSSKTQQILPQLLDILYPLEDWQGMTIEDQRASREKVKLSLIPETHIEEHFLR